VAGVEGSKKPTSGPQYSATAIVAIAAITAWPLVLVERIQCLLRELDGLLARPGLEVFELDGEFLPRGAVDEGVFGELAERQGGLVSHHVVVVLVLWLGGSQTSTTPARAVSKLDEPLPTAGVLPLPGDDDRMVPWLTVTNYRLVEAAGYGDLALLGELEYPTEHALEGVEALRTGASAPIVGSQRPGGWRRGAGSRALRAGGNPGRS
jgi:hypothetical protein